MAPGSDSSFTPVREIVRQMALSGGASGETEAKVCSKSAKFRQQILEKTISEVVRSHYNVDEPLVDLIINEIKRK